MQSMHLHFSNLLNNIKIDYAINLIHRWHLNIWLTHIYNLKCITVPSNLIPIAALTQSIESELA